MSSKDSSVKIFARLVMAAVFTLCLASITLTQAQGKPAGAGPPPNINPNIDTRQRQVDETDCEVRN